MLDRLCKIRRLARQSPEPGERKAGEARLAVLLKKHSLTEADLDRHESPAIRVRPRQPTAAARWTYSPEGFPGGIEIEIRQGVGFGSIFGFEFSFGFKPMGSDGTETQP